MISSSERKKKLKLKNDKREYPKSNSVSEDFADKNKGRSSSKIAERVGVSDRTLEKIRTIKEASTEGDFTKEVWKKVAAGKIKVDKGYNQVKRFQRIKEVEISVKTSLKSLSASEIFDLQFGDMKSLGENIADNSIDLIFTDPPYNEASLSLYTET